MDAFFFSWDQHHVPALEISCVLEQAETYICLSIIKGKQLWSLKRCEKEKRKSGIINLPSSETKTKKRKQITCTVRWLQYVHRSGSYCSEWTYSVSACIIGENEERFRAG